MVIKQKYNKRINAWVKYKVKNGRSKIINVKEREPRKPFKGVMKKN